MLIPELQIASFDAADDSGTLPLILMLRVGKNNYCSKYRGLGKISPI